jgi:hypothetical protein
MRRLLRPSIIGLALVICGVWIARSTEWTDVQLPASPTGEAATNPFYAVQRFSRSLGARGSWDRVLTIPPTTSVIVLSDWRWNLIESRRIALEHWVESGGRLVVDEGLFSDGDGFEKWSGIDWQWPKEAKEAATFGLNPCRRFREEGSSIPAGSTELHWMCVVDNAVTLTATRAPLWALRAEDGGELQAMRVAVGKGTVTVINATPFTYRNLLDGDHGWLFVAATELRRGDDVHFLSEESHPSLLALIWLYGRPVVLLSFVLVGFALWRGGIRFGPLAPTPALARRSLAEQIRGTGQFTLRHGGGDALHAAAVRALDEAAERRVSNYTRLSAKERAARLSEITGFERNALAAAIYHPGLRRSHELRSTIALLESARRILVAPGERRTRHLSKHHGTA